MLSFNSFLIPFLLFLLLRAVLMNHSFDIVRLEKKKRNRICFTLISKLQAIAFQIKSKQMQKKKKVTESCYCKHNILKELCM